MSTYNSGTVRTAAGAKIAQTGHSFSARNYVGPLLQRIRAHYTSAAWAAGGTNNAGWPTISKTGVSNALSSSLAGAVNFAAKIGTFMGASPPAGSFVLIPDICINDIANGIARATTIANITDALTRSNAITRADGTPLPVIMGTPLTDGEAAVGTNPFDAQIAAMVTDLIALFTGPNVLVNNRQAWIDRRAAGGGTVTSDGVHPSNPAGIIWYSGNFTPAVVF